MVGVYDYAKLYCRTCKTQTKHETGWESEDPDVLWTKCTICGLNKIRR